MKILISLIIFIFTYSSWIKADDIRDLEIEGLTLGESLLNSYSKSFIEGHKKLIYPGSDKFYQIAIDGKSSDYDQKNFVLKKNDNEYKIYNLGLSKFFENDLKNCKKFKEKKINEILPIIKNLKKSDYDHQYNIDDKKSLANISDFEFPDGSFLRVYCVDWSKQTEKKRNFVDNFSLDISLKAYLDWLNTEAY